MNTQKVEQFFASKNPNDGYKTTFQGIPVIKYQQSPLAKLLAKHGVYVPRNLEEVINKDIKKELGIQ